MELFDADIMSLCSFKAKCLLYSEAPLILHT